MEKDLLSSLELCKKKHQENSNERNNRRRTLTNIRRNLLDTTHSSSSAASSNNLETLSYPSDSNLPVSDHYRIHETQDLNTSDDKPEQSVHERMSDNTSVVSMDDQASSELNDSLDISDFDTQPDLLLHDLTSVTKNAYCRSLLTLFRDAKVCKTHCDRLIRLINSGLPTPNNMPTSMKSLLDEMQGKI